MKKIQFAPDLIYMREFQGCHYFNIPNMDVTYIRIVVGKISYGLEKCGIYYKMSVPSSKCLSRMSENTTIMKYLINNGAYIAFYPLTQKII